MRKLILLLTLGLIPLFLFGQIEREIKSPRFIQCIDCFIPNTMKCDLRCINNLPAECKEECDCREGIVVPTTQGGTVDCGQLGGCLFIIKFYGFVDPIDWAKLNIKHNINDPISFSIDNKAIYQNGRNTGLSMTTVKIVFDKKKNPQPIVANLHKRGFLSFNKSVKIASLRNLQTQFNYEKELNGEVRFPNLQMVSF